MILVLNFGSLCCHDRLNAKIGNVKIVYISSAITKLWNENMKYLNRNWTPEINMRTLYTFVCSSRNVIKYSMSQCNFYPNILWLQCEQLANKSWRNVQINQRRRHWNRARKKGICPNVCCSSSNKMIVIAYIVSQTSGSITFRYIVHNGYPTYWSMYCTSMC
jgi:hypothetical protein